MTDLIKACLASARYDFEKRLHALPIHNVRVRYYPEGAVQVIYTLKPFGSERDWVGSFVDACSWLVYREQQAKTVMATIK